MLKDSYKGEKAIKLSAHLDAGLSLSVLSVIYQLVTTCLNTTDEEKQGFESKKINDYFQYLDYNENIMVSDNIDKLPKSFPDENTEMSYIFSLWKHMCFLKIWNFW